MTQGNRINRAAEKGEQFWKMFTEEAMTIRQIADRYGCTKQYINQCMNKAGKKIPKYPHLGADKKMLRDKEMFTAFLSTCYSRVEAAKRIGITDNSIEKWMEYHDIGKDILLRRKGEHSSAWKGGYFIDQRGYVWTNADIHGYREFNPNWKTHNVMVHTVVVEMILLGCKLPKRYVTHHIDLDRQNNEPKNLAILTRAQHMWIHNLIEKAQQKYGNFLLLDQKEQMHTRIVDSRILSLARQLHATNLMTIKLENHIKDINNVLVVDPVMSYSPGGEEKLLEEHLCGIG